MSARHNGFNALPGATKLSDIEYGATSDLGRTFAEHRLGRVGFGDTIGCYAECCSKWRSRKACAPPDRKDGAPSAPCINAGSSRPCIASPGAPEHESAHNVSGLRSRARRVERNPVRLG